MNTPVFVSNSQQASPVVTTPSALPLVPPLVQPGAQQQLQKLSPRQQQQQQQQYHVPVYSTSPRRSSSSSSTTPIINTSSSVESQLQQQRRLSTSTITTQQQQQAQQPQYAQRTSHTSGGSTTMDMNYHHHQQQQMMMEGWMNQQQQQQQPQSSSSSATTPTQQQPPLYQYQQFPPIQQPYYRHNSSSSIVDEQTQQQQFIQYADEAQASRSRRKSYHVSSKDIHSQSLSTSPNNSNSRQHLAAAAAALRRNSISHVGHHHQQQQLYPVSPSPTTALPPSMPSPSSSGKKKRRIHGSKRKISRDDGTPPPFPTSVQIQVSQPPPNQLHQATRITSSHNNSNSSISSNSLKQQLSQQQGVSTPTMEPIPLNASADPFGSIFSPVTSGLHEAFSEYKFPSGRISDDDDDDDNNKDNNSDDNHSDDNNNTNESHMHNDGDDDDEYDGHHDDEVTTPTSHHHQHYQQHYHQDGLQEQQTSSTALPEQSQQHHHRGSSGAVSGGDGTVVDYVEDNEKVAVLKKNLEQFKFGYNSPRTDASPLSVTSTNVPSKNAVFTPSASNTPRELYQQHQAAQQQQQQHYHSNSNNARRNLQNSFDSTQSMRSELSKLSQWQKSFNYSDSDDEEHIHDEDYIVSEEEEDLNNNTNVSWLGDHSFAHQQHVIMPPPIDEQLSPLSPARLNFQNISSVRILKQQLEMAAEATARNEKARNMLWREWCVMLRECDNNNCATYVDDNFEMMTFKEVFMKSRTIEKVTEGVIKYPDSKDLTQLWELFRCTLVGDHQDHLQLITSLTKIGTSINGKPFNVTQPIIDMAVEVVSNFKSRSEHQKLLVTSLNSLDRQILDKETQLQIEESKPPSSQVYYAKAQISRELVSLCEQKRNLLVSLSQKWHSIDAAKTFFDQCLQIVGGGDAGLYDKRQNSAIQNQLKQLAQKKSQGEEEYKLKVEELEEDISLLNTREQQLQDLKRELEQKLQQVTNDLKSVQVKLNEKVNEVQQLHNDLTVFLNDIERKENELTSNMDSETNENSLLGNLSEFVVQSKEILLTTLTKRASGLDNLIHQATQRYVEQAANHLEQQNQLMIDILKTRILVLCEKLNSMKKGYLELIMSGNEKEASSQMQHIRRYYDYYLAAEKSAKDILTDAEQINQFIHSLSPHFMPDIEQVDNQLTVLSDSENLMLKCNHSVQWVPQEIANFEQMCNLPPPASATNTASDHNTSVSTDASEISNASQHSDNRLAQIGEFLKKRQSMSQEESTSPLSAKLYIPDTTRSRSSSNSSVSSTKSRERTPVKEVTFDPMPPVQHHVLPPFDHPRLVNRRSSVSSAIPSHTSQLPNAAMLARRSSMSVAIPTYHHVKKPSKKRRSSKDAVQNP